MTSLGRSPISPSKSDSVETVEWVWSSDGEGEKGGREGLGEDITDIVDDSLILWARVGRVESVGIGDSELAQCEPSGAGVHL